MEADKMFLKRFREMYSEETIEWMVMSPKKRLQESIKLWPQYIALGGSLEPESDIQSPLCFKEIQSKGASHRRSGNHIVRSVRV